MSNIRKLMITVDVEAQTQRAEKDHLDRLIWGKFPEGNFGISEMMDIADERNVKLVMFLDYCEEHLYGDALLDVGREIHRRGHDLQLHAHPDYLSKDWWLKNGLEKGILSLNEMNEYQAQSMFDFLCDAYIRTIGISPIAYRGGGYRFNQYTLNAAHKNGIFLHSNFNPYRPTSYLGNLKRSKQFRWSNGCYEIPISTIQYNFYSDALVAFNFNSAYFPTALHMIEFLEKFYQQMGTDAIAVLVLHSWSFLELVDKRYFERVIPENMVRFGEFLDLIQGYIDVIDSSQALNLMTKEKIGLSTSVSISDLVKIEVPLDENSNLKSFTPSQTPLQGQYKDLRSEEIISKAEQLWEKENRDSVSEAVKLFQHLFDQGEVQGTAYRLGTAYYLGKGVEKDLDMAYKYLSLDNSRYALYYRGLILSDSNFSGFDLQLAFKDFSEALKMGVPNAQLHIDKILDKVSYLLGKSSLENKKEEITYVPTFCSVCNKLMEKLVKKDKCPHCDSSSRTRIFPIVMNALKTRISHDSGEPRPILGFSVTPPEREILRKVYPLLTSASLYGNSSLYADYEGNHIEGCDVRDLSRFSDGYFDGVFSICLFDYFTEIDIALAECARVTAPGGIFITHIANSRLVDGELTPTITSVIKKTETYFPYIPDDSNMPSIKVGRQTFLNAMKKSGYQTAHYSMQDEASGEKSDWFIGFLPDFKRERE